MVQRLSSWMLAACLAFSFLGAATGLAADMPAAAPVTADATCPNGTYTTIVGDTCAKVYVKVYCNNAALFSRYNGWTCRNAALNPGRVLCLPVKVNGRCS
ncbi:MAG: hypothetical protein U1E62_25200 [Alsobacter sp.]